MLLAKVIGNVVSTQKDERLVGYKLLIVKKVNENNEAYGEPIVVADTVGAGNGELVLIITGSGARLIENEKSAPIDASIVVIVDYIEVSNIK